MGTDYRGFVPGWRRGFDLGIAVASCPGINANAVAEFTMLLMLTMARTFTRQIIGGECPADPEPGMELAGRSLGILGAGRIGARVGRIAGLGLGMRVRYHGRRRNEALEHATGMTWTSWPDLLTSCDVLCLTRPSPTSGEPPVLGAAELAVLRPGALIVNVVHPGLIDPDALLVAATDRNIRAAVDPECSGPAWDRLVALGPHRFLTVPQTGYSTRDANHRTASHAAEAVCDVLDGTPSDAVHNADYLAARRSSRVEREKS